MFFLKASGIILAMMISLNCFGAPQSSGKVTKFYLKGDGLVLFKLGETSGLPAECTNSWPYGFKTTDLAGKEWFSMLLAARATGENLNIGYESTATDRCNVVYLFH